MVALIIFGVVVTYFVLRSGLKEPSKEEPFIHGWIIMLLGLFLTVVALAPFIAASFPVSLEFPSNRFLLALAPGISIFLVGAIDELLRTENQKMVLVALLCGLSIGSHFMASRGFTLQWQAQKDFFWQLTWRVPGLLPGTALVSEDVPFSQYFSGPSMTAPLNMIYSPENKSSHLDNVILLTSSPQADAIPTYERGIDLNFSYRFLDFSGNTNALIIFYKPSNGCLRLFSPEILPKNLFSLTGTPSGIIRLPFLTWIGSSQTLPSVPLHRLITLAGKIKINGAIISKKPIWPAKIRTGKWSSAFTARLKMRVFLQELSLNGSRSCKLTFRPDATTRQLKSTSHSDLMTLRRPLAYVVCLKEWQANHLPLQMMQLKL